VKEAAIRAVVAVVVVAEAEAEAEVFLTRGLAAAEVAEAAVIAMAPTCATIWKSRSKTPRAA
jgi:hypothetical protein